LCPLLSTIVCPLSVSTSLCTFSLFCVAVSTAVYYSLSPVCPYLTLYLQFVLCHCVHCCLLQSVPCLSVPHSVPSVCSVSLCPLLSTTVCPLSVRTSLCTFSLLCVTVSTSLFYSQSTVFVDRLEVCQMSCTQRCYRVYQHLKDLNNERLDTECSKALRYNREFLCRIFEHTNVEE